MPINLLHAIPYFILYIAINLLAFYCLFSSVSSYLFIAMLLLILFCV